MTTMDLKSVSWVGDMYQRLESMCVEVEEIMYQDTVKYVEDQMRTVGVSVKKFYSDVMEDLLPPSSLDVMKEENRILTVVHPTDFTMSTKPEATNVKKFLKMEAEQIVNDSNGAANCSNIVNYGSCYSASCDVNPFEPTSSFTIEEQCANESIENQCAELDVPNLDTCASKDLDKRQDSECSFVSVTSSINESTTTGSVENFICSEVMNESSEPLCGHADVCSKSASIANVSCRTKYGVGIAEQMTEGYGTDDMGNGSKSNMPSNRNVSPVFDGTSNSRTFCKIVSDDADQREVLHYNQLNEVKLGESCVLVEKSEHSLLMPHEHKKISSKKKIRDVFTPRRWSKGKQNQEQLAVCYEDQNGKNLHPTSLMHESIKGSNFCEFSESEWEIL